MWAEPSCDEWLRRNSHVQGWLFLATDVVAYGGIAVLLGVPTAAGLSIRPIIAGLGIGTFDGLDMLFFFMWAGMFQLMSIHNGLRYRLTVFKVHVPRSRESDVVGFVGFTLVAILWGVLAVHPVFASRAVDPTYLNRLPSGAPASSLQHGVVVVTTTYFVLVALVVVLIAVGRLFNPIDFDEYDRYLRRVLHLPPSRNATSN